MLCIPLTLDLQALIGQVDVYILVLQVVLGRARSQVAILVEVNPIVLSNHGPDSDVKLSAIKEEGVFHILLHHPRLGLRIFLENELIDVSQIAKKFDSFALVH